LAAAAILDFLKFITVGQLKRIELPRRAKFGRNQSNHGRDMAIFQDGSGRHLRFLIFKFLTVGRLKMVKLRRHAKFGQNQSNRSRDMAIFRFFKMAAAAILDF